MSRPSHWSVKPLYASVLTVCVVATSGCASYGETSSIQDAGPASFSDAGAIAPSRDTRRVCASINECSANEICLFESGLPSRHCDLPSGACTPGDDFEGTPRTCYPDSRCATAPRVGTAAGESRCTLTPAALQAFQTRERITTMGPTERDAITATTSLTLNWQPPSQSTGENSTAVAVIMTEPPTLRVETRQIQNTAAVRWIWSSADPGGAMVGRVTFDQGHRGIQHDGTVNPARWGRQTFFDNGIYYWFVFNVADGQVVRSSNVQQFRVGQELPIGSCRSAIQCARLGEVPESFACIHQVCQRRCASEVDCAAVGGRCNYGLTYPNLPNTGRHSGFCVFSGLPDASVP